MRTRLEEVLSRSVDNAVITEIGSQVSEKGEGHKSSPVLNLDQVKSHASLASGRTCSAVHVAQ